MHLPIPSFSVSALLHRDFFLVDVSAVCASDAYALVNEVHTRFTFEASKVAIHAKAIHYRIKYVCDLARCFRREPM